MLQQKGRFIQKSVSAHDIWWQHYFELSGSWPFWTSIFKEEDLGREPKNHDDKLDSFPFKLISILAATLSSNLILSLIFCYALYGINQAV